MKQFCSMSEAIREGAKIRPQGVGTFFAAGKTCALGAGAEAIGFSERALSMGCFEDLTQLYSYLKSIGTCPVPECKELSSGTIIGRVVTHLNDEHLWTREAIADWLETEEEKLGYVTLVEPERSESKSSLLTVSV